MPLSDIAESFEEARHVPRTICKAAALKILCFKKRRLKRAAPARFQCTSDSNTQHTKIGSTGNISFGSEQEIWGELYTMQAKAREEELAKQLSILEM
jgi:hypothetical protein